MESKEEINISGMAGRFPECENTQQFKEALLNGIDLVTTDSRRYPPGVLGTPERQGKIPTIDKFDAGFFGVHPKLANYMDPRQRALIETVYECIIDAGYNPKELRGTRTGVYVGIGSPNNSTIVRQQKTDGYSNIGLSVALAANRISYAFDFKGPSYSLDTACSSSIYAFVHAIRDIERGETESAIVCGTQINFDPNETSEFKKLNMISADGKCKVFNKNRDGYVRSESVGCLLLQKKRSCRRIYATCLGAKTNCDGYKSEGITCPSDKVQLRLMREIYSQTKINPRDVTYIEAHGTGTPIGDQLECQSLVNMFCQDREQPLPIGAVKSNMGHSELASGICAIAKVLFAMETGIIPANLHVEPLDTDLPGISDQKLKVVTENLPWSGGIVGLNSFGFGGANAHIILKSNDRNKQKTYILSKHRLVQVSGRTEEAVSHFLDEIQAHDDDEEFLALVDEIHKMNIDGHNFRGYAVLGNQPIREIQKVSKDRPVWFIYAGMGSQWTNMGRDLMKIEIFRNTINRCADALKPYNIDLIDIIMNESPSVLDDLSNCFCGIVAIEIALTDVLYSLGIYPDGIAGHSLGEVGCAYADGHITPEQGILLGYARGYAIKNSKIDPGQMAAVGLSKDEILNQLPEDVFLACQNGKDSVTISGSEKSTKAFVEKLSSQGIFAKLVKSGGVAFHTKYIMPAAEHLLDFCREVLKDPKPRSSKWISTSVPSTKTELNWTKYNCAEYHHNNFCSTVLFDQIYQNIPDNAIVIEIAPHGLLQAILKRELTPDATYISLTNRSHPDNELFFLSSIGKIFTSGCQPNLRKLYHDVSFPVSRGTTMLSPMVQWDHSVSWFTPLWKNHDSFGKAITVNLANEKYTYLQGHNIDGRVLMPGTGYLELVWEVIANMELKNMETVPVVMKNIKFKRATVLPPSTDVTFLVNIMKQSGNFEIFEGGSVVVTGSISVPKDINTEFLNADKPVIPRDSYLLMDCKDLYKECRLRRYLYKDYFQGISNCDVHGLQGKIEWKGKFASFLDTMLHLSIITQSSRDLFLPTSIEQVVIDPIKHLEIVNKEKELLVINNQDLNVIKSGGIEITGTESSRAPRRQQTEAEPYLEIYEFVPYSSSKDNGIDFDTALRIALQIIVQNSPGQVKSPKICEVVNKTLNSDLSKNIKAILDEQPMTDTEYCTAEPNKINGNYDVVVLSKLIVSEINTDEIVKSLNNEGFILYVGQSFSELDYSNLQIIYQSIFDENSVYLLRHNNDFPKSYAIVNVSNFDFDWLEKLKVLSESETERVVYLLSQGEDIIGVVGLMNCLIKEPGKVTYRSIIIEQDARVFSANEEFYREQLRKNLTFNVLKNNTWGTYAFLPFVELKEKEVSNASTTITTIGDLSSLSWVERPTVSLKYEETSDLVYVFYSALNFKDVMLATGKIQQAPLEAPTAPTINIGLEYSGITASGGRVMGLLGYEGLALQVQTDPSFTWVVPESWSLQDAATVPCVYATCYYALIIRGQMQPGESILIHAGTGGIGMAAISIALSMGCTIYTTVSTKEKRDFLKKTFPELEDDNIGNSRNRSFEKMILKNTKRRGVDLVLNSLSADLFHASLRCIAQRGRFLEIGKVDLLNGTPIDAKIFLKNCSFHGVLLDDLFDSHTKVKAEIRDKLTEGLASGVVRPLPSTVFNETEVETAFRFLSSGKHKGKVLIQIRKEDPGTIKSPARTIIAIPKIYFDSAKSYILIGGLGGFGLELTDWLIKRGATKIILNSRRNIFNGYQSFCLKKWSEYKNIVVKISTADTSNIKGAEQLVSEAKNLGVVGGVFNMALNLKDGLISNQTKRNFEAVFKSKIISGQNMDIVTRNNCSELDHFVVFSSIASGRGNTGQTNYGMANSALERLCEKRRHDGLAGLAVQWGPIGDVGALMNMSIEEELRNQFILTQNITSCLNTLEKFMLRTAAVGASTVLADRNGTTVAKKAKSPAEAVAHILGIRNIDLVDKSQSLVQLGLDSLMIAEIKQTLYRNHQLEMSTEEIRELTLDYLFTLGNSEINSSNTATATNDSNSTSIQNQAIEDIYNVPNYIITKQTIVNMNNSGNKQNIFFIHPIEGHVDILRPLGRKLKATVYGLQCTRDADYDDMSNFAGYYIQQIKRVQPKSPYCLCGYSYGSALALEIGLQLEAAGDKVDMVLIDGSPLYVKKILTDGFVRHGNTIDTSKAAVLRSFSSTFSNVDQDEVHKLIENSSSWEEKIAAVSDLISKKTGIDSDEIAVSADRFFKRCHAAYYYEPTGKFKGKMTLIRREDNPFFLSDNYELQKVSEQNITVIKIKGDHRTILLGDNTLKISEIINNIFVL